MWTEIFKQMRSKDRKSFRISCKRWRDCCNRHSIQKLEKLHLPGTSNLTDIVATLLTSKRSILNLKFSNHRFEGVDLPIWQKCGPAIEHLELQNCAITHSSMKEILIRCTKLSYLALRNVQIVHRTGIRYFDETFIRIGQSQVIASSVKTLVFDIYELLSDAGLESLLSIFPNVKDLEFDFHHLSHLSVEYREPELFQLAYYDDNQKSYTCENFAKCLATNLLQLERLKVKTPSRYCECAKFIRETPFFKLKTAEFYNNQTFRHNKSFLPRIYSFNTSSDSNNITSIEICALVSIKAITRILRKSPNLRKIEIAPTFGKHLCNFIQFYEALAHSKLESVSIISMRNTTPAPRPTYQVLGQRRCPANYTVKELRIEAQCQDDSLISILLQCFAALTHFHLKIRSSESNIGTIFNHTNLKCIELESSHTRTLPEDPCTLHVQSILPSLFIDNLEYLSIEMNILRALLVQQPAIFFSDLRYLHISSPKNIPMPCGSNSTQPLKPWEIKCFPLYNLEGVYMDVSKTGTEDIDNFFSSPFNFPRIQYIGIRLGHRNYLHYKTLFESWFSVCPCLTTIIILYQRTGVVLYYDPIRGEIRECYPENSRIPGQLIWHQNNDSELNTGITLFHYFMNLKSFSNFWKSNS